MKVTTDTSANQLYRAAVRSGQTTLDFKSWLQLQKTRNFSNLTGTDPVPANPALNDPIQSLLSQIHEEGGQQTTLDSNYTFGVANAVWLWGGLAIGLGILTAVIVHQYRKK